MNTTTWLQELQQEPWFSSVASQFSAQGVPAALWEATLLDEDASLNPQIAVNDNGGISYGLFQLRQPGIGAGYNPSTLEDPVQNAKIAAAAMGSALQSAGVSSSTPLSQQLQVIEKAGWPGDLSEDAKRQSELASVQSGGTLLDKGMATLGAGAQLIGNTAASGAATLAGGTASALGLPSTQQINNWIVMGTVGAVLLGVLAGGFMLLASGGQNPAGDAALAAAA